MVFHKDRPIKDQLALADFNQLSDIIKKVLLTKGPQSCDLKYLGKKVSGWTKQDLLKVLPGLTEDDKV